MSKRVPALVHAKALTVGYGGAAVCAPVSFDLRPGQAVALVGENGSGKSTVLRAALGQLAPQSGELKIADQAIDEREASFRRRVAWVLDEDAYFPALSVIEHLALVARAHGTPDAERKVDELLDAFALTDHADYLPTSLSSGQRRRLLLVAALVRPFELLVLDEPEQRLDTPMRRDLADRLVALRTAGKGILFATHDPALLATAATQAVWLSDEAARVLSPEKAAEAISAMPS